MRSSGIYLPPLNISWSPVETVKIYREHSILWEGPLNLVRSFKRPVRFTNEMKLRGTSMGGDSAKLYISSCCRLSLYHEDYLLGLIDASTSRRVHYTAWHSIQVSFPSKRLPRWFPSTAAQMCPWINFFTKKASFGSNFYLKNYQSHQEHQKFIKRTSLKCRVGMMYHTSYHDTITLNILRT